MKRGGRAKKSTKEGGKEDSNVGGAGWWRGVATTGNRAAKSDPWGVQGGPGGVQGGGGGPGGIPHEIFLKKIFFEIKAQKG